MTRRFRTPTVSQFANWDCRGFLIATVLFDIVGGALAATDALRIAGALQHGCIPEVVLTAVSNGYRGTVELTSVSTNAGFGWWLLVEPHATCRITLSGGKGRINGCLDPNKPIPELDTIDRRYQGVPRRDRPSLWLRLDLGGAVPIQRFTVQDIVMDSDRAVPVLKVTPMLYRVREETKTAELVKFTPIEVQLPQIEAGQGTSPALPSASGSTARPTRAGDARTDSVADLREPSARWLPWGAGGLAVATLLVAGLLARHRRRARRAGPPRAP
jgi:hypothetical protein